MENSFYEFLISIALVASGLWGTRTLIEKMLVQSMSHPRERRLVAGLLTGASWCALALVGICLWGMFDPETRFRTAILTFIPFFLIMGVMFLCFASAEFEDRSDNYPFS